MQHQTSTDIHILYCLHSGASLHFITSGWRLRYFNITVGPFNGTYKACGTDANVIPTGGTRSFLCEYRAIGTTLTITVDNRRILTLCEVQIYGKGIVVHMMILHCN